MPYFHAQTLEMFSRELYLIEFIIVCKYYKHK